MQGKEQRFGNTVQAQVGQHRHAYCCEHNQAQNKRKRQRPVFHSQLARPAHHCFQVRIASRQELLLRDWLSYHNCYAPFFCAKARANSSASTCPSSSVSSSSTITGIRYRYNSNNAGSRRMSISVNVYSVSSAISSNNSRASSHKWQPAFV